MDWKQLAPTLMGAVIALLSSVVTQWWTSKREGDRRAAEERERATRELKAAYARWFESFIRLSHSLSGAWIAQTQGVATFTEVFTREVEVMGYAVRLLESNAEARKRTGDLVVALTVMLANVGTFDGTDPMAVARVTADAMKQLAEFETWLVEVRFARR